MRAPDLAALGRLRPRRHHRRVWTRAGRTHIEVHHGTDPRAGAMRDALARELTRLQGVHWAEVNAVLGRVVVAFDPDGPSIDDLIEIVEEVEARHAGQPASRLDHAGQPASELDHSFPMDGVESFPMDGVESFPMDGVEHPGDVEPLRRHAIALAADTVAMGASFLALGLQLTPVPTELASAVSVIQNEPRVRHVLEQHLGRSTTDLGLGVANAFAQAICQGPLALAVDITHRVNLIGEIRARKQCWERCEPLLAPSPASDAVGPLSIGSRPVPLPHGAAERYADLAALASLGAFGASLAFTRSPRRSAALIVASLPKAANHGREAFAAHLGRALARRDVVVLDGTCFDRLDRVDTVVLDADVARPGGRLDPLAPNIIAAARREGLTVVVSGGGEELRARLDADRAVRGGSSLRSSVRRLQANGAVVLLIASGRSQDALAAADVGIGTIVEPSAPPPWAADLLSGPGLAQAHFVVQAVGAARRVSRQSALVALGGSGVAGLMVVAGPAAASGNRASIPINVAALVAQVNGIASAASVAHRPAPAPTPRAGTPWHEMEPAAVLDALGTSATGLTPEEARRRRVERKKEPTLLAKVGRALGAELTNPLTPILAAGAGLSAAVGSLSDAGLVAGVTAANALIGTVQRVRADVSIAHLSQASDAVVDVVRSGAHVPLARDRLVPGDVVALEPGDVVPADCRILWSAQCEVDESALTGESMPVPKETSPSRAASVADRRSMLYDGTTVSSGHVLGVVVAVGPDTELGRSLAGAPDPPPSGVESRLTNLSAAILPATVASGATVTALGLLRAQSPRRAVSSGVGLMVAAVPEGLPLLATTAQQAAARRLAARGALVRNPRTVEALGRVDTLCFDKTGTLTLGEITLQRVSDGTSDEPLDALGARGAAVLAAAVRASPNVDDEEVGALLHATDHAVLEGARRAGVLAQSGIGNWSVVGELPFDSARGFHAVVGTGAHGALLCVKGAPEVVLPRSESWSGAGTTVPLDRTSRRRLDAEVERLAERGLRVLAVAQRAATGRPGLDEERVAGLDLLGFVGLADAVRPSAAAAVRDLRAAGVDVVMVTGDHPSTAGAVASELGILNGHRVVTGPDLDAMSEAALDEVLPGVSVFARVAPADKVRIVEAYQRAGRVVAMTGDGANDAPAIRLAHTGIAIGRRSTAPAREAADLVVLDDRMETILDAIAEGRALWVSVRDALGILVGGNLGEVAFSVAASAISGASPLGARQFLLVNLMTDMVPAMVVASRRPSHATPADLLSEGPDRSLGSALTGQIALRAAATSGGATAAWLVARATGRRRRASTVALAALVGTQLGQTAWVGRDSPLVLVSSVASAAALVTVVQTPVLSHFFGCTPLGPVGWSIAAGSAAVATGAAALGPRAFSALRAGRGARVETQPSWGAQAG